jgi:hypothetical protein
MIAIPIVQGKFEIGMQSRSNPQNNVIFWITPIHDPILQKPAPRPDATLSHLVKI